MPNIMEKPILKWIVEKLRNGVRFQCNTDMENKFGKTVQNTKEIGIKENLLALVL